MIVTEFVGDTSSYEEIKKQALNQNVIVSTVGAKSVEQLVKIAENIVKVVKENGQRIVWSGGAGSLWTNTNTRLVDLSEDSYPPEWKPAIIGHAKVLELFQNNESVKWSYMSPALDFQDTEQKGPYLIKESDYALYNQSGESYASYISGAKALKNEILNSKYLNKRFTIVEEY